MPSMEPMTILGAYRLLAPLGQGGMGQVWRAEHVQLGRPAAVKVIRPDVPEEARARMTERFAREAKATAALTSQHTVTVHDFGTTPDGSLWYAMELLDGLDCETLVAADGPQPPARVVHLLLQMCDALMEAHALGLVHRDIKPANLVVCRQGARSDILKVLDFGLSRPLLQLDETRLTADGALTGSPAWIAPEAAMGDPDLDQRADLYGLGCVAYWLLTGRQVFVADQPMRLIMLHVGQAPQPPSSWLPQPLPPDLEALVLQCLAKSPADRPADAAEVAARLRACALPGWTEDDARQWWARRQSHPVAQGTSEDGPTADGTMGAPLIQARPEAPAPAPAAVAPIPGPVRAQAPNEPRFSPLQLSSDRALTVVRLQEAFAHSLLDMPEFERRVARAEAAKSPAELPELLADLPKPVPAVTQVPTQPGTALALAPSRQVAIFSGYERGGLWRPPPRTDGVYIFGGAQLDYRQAELQPGCTSLNLVCIFGGVEITVPEDLPVVVEGFGIFGAFHKRGGSDSPPVDPQKPWLKITGAAIFGGVQVRIKGKRKLP